LWQVAHACFEAVHGLRPAARVRVGMSLVMRLAGWTPQAVLDAATRFLLAG